MIEEKSVDNYLPNYYWLEKLYNYYKSKSDEDQSKIE